MSVISMKRFSRAAQCCTFVLLLLEPVNARSWREITPLHGLEVKDNSAWKYLIAENPLFTEVPSQSPSSSPSQSPSQSPTASPVPSAMPSTTPSALPSSSPSLMPSSAPSVTPDPFPANPVPTSPDRGYFNYDTSPNAQYGPGYVTSEMDGKKLKVSYKNNRWSDVGTPRYHYWSEFGPNGEGPWKGALSKYDLNLNQCDNVGRQSPIDVRENGAICHEFHEVRSLRGEYEIGEAAVIKLIEHNKLRVIYPRRPCPDYENPACDEPDPPYADFPNGWTGFADVMNIDVKVPSEHLLNGERFDAEMQIYHLHLPNRRIATQTVLIRAKPSGHNYYFQDLIDAFDSVYRYNHARCAATNRRERKLQHGFEQNIGFNVTDGVDRDVWSSYSTAEESPTFDRDQSQAERKLNVGVWDPHHPMLIPTIYFYRYDGSLTEPPCSEYVSWWVADKPMIISTDQLEQLQRILFLNVDKDCKGTSTQFAHSVARPIQETRNRPVWQCTPEHYGPDP